MELMSYQLSKLEVLIEQGFKGIDQRLTQQDGRISAIEIWQARTDESLKTMRDTLNKVELNSEVAGERGMSNVVKISLAALAILSTLVAAIAGLMQLT